MLLRSSPKPKLRARNVACRQFLVRRQNSAAFAAGENLGGMKAEAGRNITQMGSRLRRQPVAGRGIVDDDGNACAGPEIQPRRLRHRPAVGRYRDNHTELRRRSGMVGRAAGSSIQVSGSMSAR